MRPNHNLPCVLGFFCPVCGAEPHHWCSGPIGDRPSPRTYHPERVKGIECPCARCDPQPPVPPPWDVAEAVIAGVEFQRTRAKGFDLSIGCPECGAPQFHFCRSETAKNERLYISHAARRLAGRKLHELRRQRGLVEPRYWRG